MTAELDDLTEKIIRLTRNLPFRSASWAVHHGESPAHPAPRHAHTLKRTHETPHMLLIRMRPRPTAPAH